MAIHELDRVHNAGGRGPIRAGDSAMAFGDIAEGSNQRNRVVVDVITGPENEWHTFRREPGFEYRLYLDGVPTELKKAGDINTRDYKRGFLAKKPRVEVIAMNTMPTAISVPATVTLRDASHLECVVTSYFVCNPEFHENVRSNLNGDYATRSVERDCEIHIKLTAENMEKLVHNTLANMIRSPMRNIDVPEDYIEDLTSQFLGANRRNGVFAMMGFSVVAAEVRFGESSKNELERMRNRLIDEGKLRETKIMVDGENNMLQMRFIMDEYNAYGGR